MGSRDQAWRQNWARRLEERTDIGREVNRWDSGFLGAAEPREGLSTVALDAVQEPVVIHDFCHLGLLSRPL